MPKFSSFFQRFPSHALLAFSLLTLCGCGSRANQTAATPESLAAAKPSTPVAAAPSTPAFTTALGSYIAREEPAYKWAKISEKKIGKNDVTTLQVTSQTWQGIEWKHRVEIARPEKIEFPGWALLYLSTTDSVIESILAQSLATKMGATTIHVMGIPNQPLFGKREDALMAHSFSQFIAGKANSEDDTWPLLLPMTKGANKVMDAVQEYSAQQKTPLNKFIVTGASKRGWVAWLLGATDTKNRIGGLIPMVYDNLNTAAQLPHQKEAWGDLSPMIEDYTRNNLQEKMRTPRGIELTKLIDPYYYRSRLTMPKLIVNATNDQYWTTDSLNLYWNDLPEPKSVYYAPNVGHTMEGDLENVFGTSAAWFRRVAGAKEIPTVQLELRKEEKQFYVVTQSPNRQPTASKIQVWMARSASRDFRKARWQMAPAKYNDAAMAGRNIYTSPAPSENSNDKYIAAFATVEFAPEKNQSSLHFSSPIIILKNGQTEN